MNHSTTCIFNIAEVPRVIGIELKTSESPDYSKCDQCRIYVELVTPEVTASYISLMFYLNWRMVG